MDTTGESEASEAPGASAPPRPRAPQPPRPDVVVTPLHALGIGPGPAPHALTAAFTAWAASFAVFAAVVGVLAVDYGAVTDALAAGLSARNPTADPTAVDQAAALSMLAVGGIGMLLVLAALFALVRLRTGRGRARVWLTLVGALTAIASVTAWNLLADAGDVSFMTLTWAPLLQAALAVAGTALLFAPSVSAWLRHRSIS